jgi:hypothetical protein
MILPKLGWRRAVLVTAVAVAGAACANYADQLGRAERHYQNARYEASMANLEDLDPHLAALSRDERARFAFVRGMTHLRLDQRPDARHWLALAREEAREAPAALNDDARATIERALVELDPLAPASTSAGTSGASSTPSSSSSAGPRSSSGSGSGSLSDPGRAP